MIRSLVAQWRWRLKRVAMEVRCQGESVESEEAWLWAIRIRILTFLIKRYGMVADIERPMRASPRPLAVVRETFCIVDDPVYHGPRDVTEIRLLLDRVHEANQRRGRRWRLWA